jgi:hypothetical protein
MQNRRITRTLFPICSTCPSRSQATLCPYTRRLIPNQPEVTFVRLRYTLGGNRPSQTARLTLSRLGNAQPVRTPVQLAWYPTIGSDAPGEAPSKLPTYPVRIVPRPKIRLQ